MKHVMHFLAMMAGVGVVVAGSPEAALAADNVSYSGRYSPQRPKNTPKGSTDSLLEALLKQIKGVGTLIALTFLLTLEDPHRFRQEACDPTDPFGEVGDK